jgi:hypothetical protein
MFIVHSFRSNLLIYLATACLSLFYVKISTYHSQEIEFSTFLKSHFFTIGNQTKRIEKCKKIIYKSGSNLQAENFYSFEN